MALIYIFKYPQPGQWDRIYNPRTGSAREEDIAIAMSQFSFLYKIDHYLFDLKKYNDQLTFYISLIGRSTWLQKVSDVYENLIIEF